MMIVVGLVFALLYYLFRGITVALYREPSAPMLLRGEDYEQSWAYIIAGILHIVCFVGAVFCFVFAATRVVLS